MFGLTYKQLAYTAVIGFSAAYAAQMAAEEGALGKKARRMAPQLGGAVGVATGLYAGKLFAQGNP
jgi:hypothetical protein